MQQIDITNTKKEEWLPIALETLQAGGIVIYPTETCYGVAVDATNDQAVSKLISYKHRPEGKAISIAVDGQKMAKKYIEVNETAQNLFDTFLPGPLTIVCHSRHKVDSKLEAENATLGIRIPDYPVILELISQFGKPITSTSANSAGQRIPYQITDIMDNISQKQMKLIDLILDAGCLPHNPPSTVVDTTFNEEKILRQGQVQFLNISDQISGSEDHTQQIASQMIKKIQSENDDKMIIFSLQGDLGSGKTQFAKGIGRTLGITQPIISPTFTIVNEYPFQHHKFIHIDTWRLTQWEELQDYLLPEYFKPGNIMVIEWSEKILDYLKKLNNQPHIKVVWVTIEYQKDLNQRKITSSIFQ